MKQEQAGIAQQKFSKIHEHTGQLYDALTAQDDEAAAAAIKRARGFFDEIEADIVPVTATETGDEQKARREREAAVSADAEEAAKCADCQHAVHEGPCPYTTAEYYCDCGHAPGVE